MGWIPVVQSNECSRCLNLLWFPELYVNSVTLLILDELASTDQITNAAESGAKSSLHY